MFANGCMASEKKRAKESKPQSIHFSLNFKELSISPSLTDSRRAAYFAQLHRIRFTTFWKKASSQKVLQNYRCIPFATYGNLLQDTCMG